MINKDLNSRAKPFIRWAGSKKKLLSNLKENSPDDYKRYVEPFCGSACLFFYLNPECALLSDFNEDLINAYVQVRENPDIYRSLKSLPVGKEFYYEMRSKDVSLLNEYDRAIRFIYLNRYCFNGIYRTNKSGQFNVPYGSKTGSFPSEYEFSKIRAALSRAEISVGDFRKTIERVQEADFVYLDPPYSAGGRYTGEYGDGSFDATSLPDLYESLGSISRKGAYFLLSYRGDDLVVEELKEKYIVEEVSVKRHVSGFKKSWDTAKEILVRNYG